MVKKRTDKFKKRRLKLLRYNVLFLVMVLCICIAFKLFIFAKGSISSSSNKEEGKKVEAKGQDKSKIKEQKKPPVEITLTSVGDCTIGTDPKFDRATSLPTVVNNNGGDYSYLFRNVASIFENDDITIANLETTFTNATEKAEKTFTFKAPPEFAKSLNLGSIEGVNISNNHIHDFLDKGFKDTLDTLNQYKVGFFGEGNKWIKEIKGIKFGFLGYGGWEYTDKFAEKLKKDIQEIKSKSDFVVINFHWGEEGRYYPNDTQKKIAHYAVDEGADLIIGHHPHVVQGIEKYKDKVICYSMGNFCFGGNSNPSDKDTFILQAKINFEDSKLKGYNIKAIPCRISSVTYKNDYMPTPLQGDEKLRVLNKINKISAGFNFKVSDSF